MENKNEKAFTLLETMIAIALLSIGVVGSLYLISKATGSIIQGNNNLIASNLAAEGIELVRNERDSNWLSGNNWWYGLCSTSSTPAVGTSCAGSVSYDNSGNNLFIQNGPTQLYKNSSGFYTSTTSSSMTPFLRTITLTYDADNTIQSATGSVSTVYLNIISTVNWVDRGNNVSISVEDNLYNWR